MLSIHYQKGKAVNIFCFLLFFLFCSNLFAQQTNNLQVIWQKTSPDSVIAFGRCIASGDVNGDGYKDLIIVGDSLISYPGQPYLGKCWVFYGGINFDTIPDVQLLNFQQPSSYNFLFTALHSCDINSDGFDDVILGACHNSPEEVLIFLGRNPMDTICDYRVRAPIEGEFGVALASGDVNGDGYKDLIVGAAYTPVPPVGWQAGRVYIYYGGQSFDTIPDVILNGGHCNDIEAFGTQVAGAGDVNDDGYEDVIVGAWSFGPGFQGRIYIYLGGNPMDTSYDVAMMGEQVWETLGEFGLDFMRNHNRYDYAVVGSPLWSFSGQDYSSGRVLILFGGQSIDSIPDIIIIGRTTDSWLGFTVSRINIVQDYDWLIAGAPQESYLPNDSNFLGFVYLWQGEPNFDTVPDAWMSGWEYEDNIGFELTKGDFDGDGHDEIVTVRYLPTFFIRTVLVCKYTGVVIEEHLTPNAKRLTLQVSPNPVRSVFSIRCPFVVKEMKIYDISGKIVKKIASPLARNDNQTDTKICVKELPSGIYFVEITTEQEDKTIAKILIVK